MRRCLIAVLGSALASGCLRFDGGTTGTATESRTDDPATATDRTTAATATEEPTSDAETTTTEEAETDMDRLCEENPVPGSVETTWPLAYGDAANTNYRPDEAVAREKPCIAWKAPSSRPLYATVVGEDVVLKSNEGDYLTAWDRVTGEVAWSTEDSIVDTLSFVRWPQIDDGTVYCSAFNDRTHDKPVIALDAADGTVQWTNALDTPSEVKTGLTIAHGTVYVAATTDSSTIYALSPEDGSVVWQRSVDGDARIAGTLFGVDRERLYVTADNEGDDTIQALDKTTGEKQWGFETLNGSDRALALADGEVYYATGDGEVFRLDGASGRPQWKGSIDTRGYGPPSPSRATRSSSAATT
jgi:outer membrane protein assembly factor BamB